MKNTIRTLIFLVSFFVFFGLFRFVGIGILNVPANYTLVLGLTCYVMALCTQALLKHIFIISRLKKQTIAFSLPVKAFTMRDRLNLHALPLMGSVIPWIYIRPTINEAIFTLFVLAIYMAVIEVVQKFGESTLKIHFAKDGIAITGYDFRPDFTIPFQTNNMPSYYDYSRLTGFLADEKSISVFQRIDMNNVIIEASEKELARIAALLLSKEVVPETN